LHSDEATWVLRQSSGHSQFQASPKKKPDVCPSDEKQARKVKDKEDKENDEAFAAAAPYFFNNSECEPLQQGKAIPFRKDLTTAKDAVKGWKERKTPTVQSVIAPDSKKKISCKPPPPDPTPSKSHVDFEDDVLPPTKPGVWSLKDSAYKDEFAFLKAVKVEKADVLANRVANAARKIARATDKEGDEVFGDILMEIRIGIWRPAEAKGHVNAFAYGS